jgi:hypothetical protein
MKARLILSAFFLALTFQIFGQEKGNWSLTFSAMPTFDWLGNALNGTDGNLYDTEGHLLNQWNTNGVMIKSANGANGMSRFFVGVNASSMMITNEVFDDLSASPNDLVTDTKLMSSTTIALGYGLERFRGDKFRLKYGVDFMLLYGTGNNASHAYGNSFGDGNIAPIATVWNETTASSEAPQASRITSSNSGSQIGLGVSPFVGAEYFLKEKFSLGIEFHLATSLNTTLQRSREVYTSYDALSQSLYQTETRGSGFTAFSSAPALMGGGLLFTIYL